ncbi:UDP-N-acetylmuramate dehydrogenase [Opitutus sp. ER46]|uniref:UDP-N-acetylmuramate dehydrogenase n=1 Tax=Opitutus sp. ER46 TaxID=2161864 RepID=UPI000D31D7E1|nr:UDP-N-acetylmuramate dehydrogenase [Opitutus sp. ER46]PTX90799.1 UDP-N-acetylenolpyruvoylglucosamine reductase [Opitutus sp. ER46]
MTARPDNGVARPALFGHPVTRLHCVGVGGMGVGPLAIYLARLGFTVSGEDDALTPEMREQLGRAGVTVGPMPGDAELLVYSSAIAPGHPARVAADARQVRGVRRGELLAEVTRGRKLVAVCGSHGKTTTTAMLITALRAAGFPAGYVLGGLFADGTAPAEAGSNAWVIAEIDESDGTIGAFSPEITVAVNLDWDHPDHYRSAADIEGAFLGLFARTRGHVLVSDSCAMSARVRERLTGGTADVRTFGPHGDFLGAVVAEADRHMTLRLEGRFTLREAEVRARGAFNAANATAALAAAQLMGAATSRAALVAYPAVRRRQAILESSDITVLEDYAHHPAEIRALLTSLRTRAGQGRLVVVFQPHRHSRTAQFLAEFADVLTTADLLCLLDVYSAGEKPVRGGTTEHLAAAVRKARPDLPVTYCPKHPAGALAALTRDVRAGDLVAFVGAGDIDRLARRWLESRRGEDRWDAFFAAEQPKLAAATKFKREEPLAGRTTIRIGGAARLYAEPASLADLQTLLRAAAAAGVPVFPLGRGSNLLVPDDGVHGLVISLAHEVWTKFEAQPDGSVWAGAGLRLKNLCGLAAKAGLQGFEFLEGIPGSVGGALRMNAGAMGGWMFDVVEELQLITLAGDVQTLAKPALHVEYRDCAELHDAIALAARLRPAAPAAAGAIRQQMDAYARKRHESQPREPSAGCVFRNPPGNSAGRLIDECGLKGERVGDAEVSPVHANFIVNRGHATSADVLELVRRVRARVRAARGVDLHPEVLLYGKRWDDVL